MLCNVRHLLTNLSSSHAALEAAMSRFLTVTAIAAVLGSPAMAGDDISHTEKVAITAYLAEKGCVGDSDDIERAKFVLKTGTKVYGYEYDDVKCNDGKTYDFRLDGNFRVVDVKPAR